MIRAIPPENLTEFFGRNALARVIDVFVDLCLSPNDRFYSDAERALVSFVKDDSFSDVTSHVGKRVSFDPDSNVNDKSDIHTPKERCSRNSGKAGSQIDFNDEQP
jgi:hypothetical protein